MLWRGNNYKGAKVKESESEVAQLCPTMGFSRQVSWSGMPFPSPGDLPDPEIKPGSPTLRADTLPSEPPGKSSFKNHLFYGWVVCWASQVALVVKNLPANAGDIRDVGSISGSGRSPGEGNGNPLQSSCLENSVNRGAWWATVNGLTKSQTWLNN